MSNGIKIVFGLNIVYLLIASIEIYFLTIPISLPISLLIYYIIINSSKKPNALEDNITTIEEKSYKQNENPTMSKQGSNALRLLIGSLLAPTILLIIKPIIYFIFESKRSHGSFISFDGVGTVIILIILYPFLAYFIYRILPKNIFSKLTPLQVVLLITFIIVVLFSLLLIFYSE